MSKFIEKGCHQRDESEVSRVLKKEGITFREEEIVCVFTRNGEKSTSSKETGTSN